MVRSRKCARILSAPQSKSVVRFAPDCGGRPMSVGVQVWGPLTWVSGAADSGGREGQPPLLTKSRKDKTIFLHLHLTDFAG